MRHRHRRLRASPRTFPDDFPERLERFKEASGLSWRKLAWHLDTSPLTIRRWRAGTRPSVEHFYSLLAVAKAADLDHLFLETETVAPNR